ncbi:hypothetical protein AW098_06905 [Escherichia coli]|nr:hypothetical protein AW098_06905 [Escherichia coli]
MGSIRRNFPTVRIINLIILIATLSRGGYNSFVGTRCCTGCVSVIKVVNKRTCLTSRFFYFLRSTFQIFFAQTTNAPNIYCA